MTKKVEQKQGALALVDRVRVVDQIEMGVMEDGTPFLTQRGLSRLCHVQPSVITEWAKAYDPDSKYKRDASVTQSLSDQGYDGDLFHKLPDGSHAYPDTVCMAVLKWYAFDAKAPNSKLAERNYHLLAGAGLRLFIYKAVGYDPSNKVPSKWREFHDRMQLNRVPDGYFSAFREISDMTIDAINAGLVMDSHTIPDGSVGSVWGRHWTANNLEEKYGARKLFPHRYPDYFPQAAANEFVKANIYPESALPEFKQWIREVYLPHKYPAYLESKVKQGALPPSSRDLLLAAFNDE